MKLLDISLSFSTECYYRQLRKLIDDYFTEAGDIRMHLGTLEISGLPMFVNPRILPQDLREPVKHTTYQFCLGYARRHTAQNRQKNLENLW